MPNKTKRIVVLLLGVALLSLGILALITKSFVIRTVLHIYLRLLFIPVAIRILQKCFDGQITNSMNKALALCSLALVLDVVVESIRFVLNNGASTVLFLPACLPICFMIIMHYSFKDTGREKCEKMLTFLIGIPLLVLSLCFEVLSFV